MTRKVFPLEVKDSVIDALDEARIFFIDLDGGNFVIGEACDGYYRRSMTKEQLSKLIIELQAIHASL